LKLIIIHIVLLYRLFIKQSSIFLNLYSLNFNFNCSVGLIPLIINLIGTCHSKDDLISLGEEIIKNYLNVLNDGKPISENEIIKHALTFIHSNIEKKIT
jgi:hypothetical protein